MTAIFICYEKTASGHGRITSSATEIDHVGFAAQLTAEKKLFMMLPLDGWTGYFTLDPDDSPAEAYMREPFPRGLAKTSVAMLETATVSAVPACSVRVTGPLSSTIQHAGGDLKMVFALPGTYTISFEAFPYLPVELTLTVRQPLTNK